MEVLLRFFGFLLLVLRWLLKPLYFIMTLREVKLLPSLKSPYLTMSATELADKIRRGKVKSEDVIRAYIGRIKDVNPLLNAIVEDRFSAALEEARKVDELVASKIKTEKQLQEETPFLGVPFTVKESCQLKGLSFCVGHIPRMGIKADKDGEAVHLVRKAGGIPLAVTTTPECCVSWETNSLVTGKTLNPYDMLKTSGGSSGGEGALLGAGASVIGVASDIAGSIRIPAMYNGVFGHKPTASVVSLNGHYPNSPDSDFVRYLTIGPMARYAIDLKPMLHVMAGERASLLKLDEKVDLRNLKIFYMDEAGTSIAQLSVDREIKERQRDAIKYLQTQFNIPAQKANFKELEDSVEISSALFFGMKQLPELMKELFNSNVQKNPLGEIFKSLIGSSKYSMSATLFYNLVNVNGFVPQKKRPYYHRLMLELRKRIEDTLGVDGVFFYPTYPTHAIYHQQSYTMVAGILYTMIFNILGFPATHVTLGFDKDAMPIGVQVIAAPYKDRLCLAVAEELERGFGGWVPPPMEHLDPQSQFSVSSVFGKSTSFF